MLINKKSLDCISTFASSDPTCYMLQGVHIEASGNLIATDGRILGIVTPGDSLEEKDFPAIGQSAGEIPALTPCTLAIDGVKALAKTIQTKSRLPIVRHARLDHTATNANGKAVFHVQTDLDNPQVVNVAKLDGTFPNYVAVMPKDTPVYRIVFDAELLKRLARAALTLGKDDRTTAIELEFTASGHSGMKATTTNKDGQTLTAIVMPWKGHRPREAYGLLVQQ